MPDVFAIVAQGEMGAGTAKRLTERGAQVATLLAGRSAASVRRAHEAGMVGVDDADALVRDADMIFSIVPPAEAVALAHQIAAALRRTGATPVFVDFNAVSPATAAKIGAALAGTDARYIDGAIIGGPPTPDYSPNFYLSGEGAADVARRMCDYGLIARPIDGPVGAASALKMSYAGITKGLTAIGAAMMLGATQAGSAEALRQEMSESLPHILAWLTRSVPRMYPKAYRWVAEMEEIAAFVADVPAGADTYRALAQFYQALAEVEDAPRAPGDTLEQLTAFCMPSQSGDTRKQAQHQ